MAYGLVALWLCGLSDHYLRRAFSQLEMESDSAASDTADSDATVLTDTDSDYGTSFLENRR